MIQDKDSSTWWGDILIAVAVFVLAAMLVAILYQSCHDLGDYFYNGINTI